MTIDIEELIKRHKKQTKASIVDADEMRIIIPVLLRKITSLEKKLSESEQYITTLETKRPPLERKGENGKAKWEIKYNRKQNRLYVGLEGIFNLKSAKIASNEFLTILSHTKKNFDVINDVRNLEAITDLKVLFHLKKAGFSVKQSSVGRIVRIHNQQNKLVSKLFGKGFNELSDSVINVSSLEEATNVLDNRENYLKP